ncbi:hypothetical protein [Actinocatenispora sera]|uniref:Uncharacterized protein n=1 Tax=Actinocatenispora sera TaxID=390989 RepID=A0A810KSY4_9ACTN|nr:hypothetical protein [Actinocatenispora sera]BCJ26190.1 hypothetical protein Asera_02980 [Actinocatenispora sera]
MATTTSPPPRHCTTCGARMWSLSSIGIRSGYNAGRWIDECADCADGVPESDRSRLPVRRAHR